MQTSKYLCSKCDSVLKETFAYVEIHSLTEECPSCGSLLAESLQRRTVQPMPEMSMPKFQTADQMRKFKFDIAKIDEFLRLGTSDLCLIVGYKANWILTRLCVRGLLPTRYGGLDSPFVFVADAGNRSDVYGAVNFGRQYGMRKQDIADRILVTRPFTIYQLKRLLVTTLPKVVQKYQVRMVIIPGLLDMFDDPNIKKKEAEKLIARLMAAIADASGKVMIVASIQPGKYADLVTRGFGKQVVLSKADRRLKAQLHDKGKRKSISLTERDLNIVNGR